MDDGPQGSGQNPCWTAHYDFASRDRLGHDGEGPDSNVIGDINVPEDRTPAAKVHAIADARYTGIVFVSTSLIPDRHTVSEYAVVSNNSMNINDNGVCMPYLKSLPNCDLGRKLNTKYDRKSQPIWELVEMIENRLSPAQKLGDAKRNHDESRVGPASVGSPILQDPFFKRRMEYFAIFHRSILGPPGPLCRALLGCVLPHLYGTDGQRSGARAGQTQRLKCVGDREVGQEVHRLVRHVCRNGEDGGPVDIPGE
jgi:hypothetical protein